MQAPRRLDPTIAPYRFFAQALDHGQSGPFTISEVDQDYANVRSESHFASLSTTLIGVNRRHGLLTYVSAQDVRPHGAPHLHVVDKGGNQHHLFFNFVESVVG